MPWIKEVEKKGRGQLWRSKFRSWKSIHLLCCLSARQDWARVLQTVYSYSIPQLQGCEQPCVTVLTKTNPPIPFLLHTMQPLLLPSADLHQGRLCKQWCSGNINNHSLDCGSIVWSGEIRISTYLPVARWSQPLNCSQAFRFLQALSQNAGADSQYWMALPCPASPPLQPQMLTYWIIRQNPVLLSVHLGV